MKNSLKYPLSLLGACIAIPLPAQADTRHSENELVGKVSFLTSTVEKLSDANLQIDPFLTSAISPPPNYKGPLFTLSHDYPTQLPAGTSFAWSKATGNGKITQANAGAYVQALKDYVSPDMRKIVYDYANWNYQNSGWYDSIWLGIEREPIRGVYVGSGFPAGTLTDQTLPVTTYVLTLYDTRAAKTLGDIWGKTPRARDESGAGDDHYAVCRRQRHHQIRHGQCLWQRLGAHGRRRPVGDLRTGEHQQWQCIE
ncbi:hypothetical protein EDF87_101290 [Pseudomonas helmanticensis]|uniref:Uncharacterized protein n=1 Tax=Pseudomonas helmanticensis TaxID=1471381 RepID=A0A4R7VVH4_9PSED|nr:hypothetical protein [Pseudomonas helmanticensis]TDV53217.1 hypothetical protein EDF87_101290 [Pseudomonas helmanticensis]